MEFYTFRFDYEGYEDKLDAMLNYIKHNCSRYVLFDEVAAETKKKHIQGKIKTVKSVVTFRRVLKESFPMLCKSNYSIAPIKKPDEYDIYITKDGNIKINNVWSQEEIDELRSQYINPSDYKKVMKEKTPNLSWSQRIAIDMEKDIPNIIEKYIELIQFETLTGEAFTCAEFHEFEKCKMRLLEYMLDKMGTQVKTVNKNVINGLFYGIINHFLMKSNAKSQWVLKIYQNLGKF